MLEKNFDVRIAMGDGRPKDVVILAKSGQLAQDKARQLHPGARSVYVIGINTTVPVPKPKVKRTPKPRVKHVFFEPPDDPAMDRSDQIVECVELRLQGKTHSAIAKTLGIGKTTVGRWLKEYG